MSDFGSPASGFDRPIALWEASHERVRRMNELLVRLVAHVNEHGADDKAKVTAQSIRRYFEEASPLHHADEELDLFPCLLAHASTKPGSIAAERIASAVASLHADHADLAMLWTHVAPSMVQIEHGSKATLDEASIALFVSRYRAHLALEEDVIEPALKRLLTQKDMAQIGANMAARRGISSADLQGDPVKR